MRVYLTLWRDDVGHREKQVSHMPTVSTFHVNIAENCTNWGPTSVSICALKMSVWFWVNDPQLSLSLGFFINLSKMETIVYTVTI